MTSRTLVAGSEPDPASGADSRSRRRAKGRNRAASLARLVERVATGDRVAFEKLYRRTVGSVHALVRRILTEDPASAEVTAEVYVRVWSAARTYDRTRHTPESWLLDLAHRCAAQRRRSSPARDPIPMTTTAGGACRALELLTPEQAAALELAYVGGATQAESAQALGVDRTTFRIRVGTALSRLRQDLDSGRTSRPTNA